MTIAQLPLEVWCKVVKYLGEPCEGGTFSKGDLCAVARVNSTTNAASSSLIYENVRIFDIDAFFLGYNHTPSNLRQSKAHWLTKTKSMIAYCSYYKADYQLGPVMAQLLPDDNLYERLAIVLPNLFKLRLFSSLDPASEVSPPSENTADYWLHLSLPAKYICRGSDISRGLMDRGERADPHIISCHRAGVRYETPTPIEKRHIVIVKTYPIRLPEHICLHDSILAYTKDFRLSIVEHLEQLIHVLLRGPVKLEFKLYGWFQSCQCGSSRDGFEKLANQLEFVNSMLGDNSPVNTNFEFFSLGEVQSCVVCGE